MYLTCGGQGGHVDPVGRYGRSRGARVGVLRLLVHVQAHVVAVFLGTDWTGEVLPHGVHTIGSHQRRTKMQQIRQGWIFHVSTLAGYNLVWMLRHRGEYWSPMRNLTDLGNGIAWFECFVLLCMYKPPAEVYTYKHEKYRKAVRWCASLSADFIDWLDWFELVYKIFELIGLTLWFKVFWLNISRLKDVWDIWF